MVKKFFRRTSLLFVTFLFIAASLIFAESGTVPAPETASSPAASPSAAPPPTQPSANQILETSISEIENLVGQGELLKAKERYQTLLKGEAAEEAKARVEKNLEDLNLKILFSPTADSKSVEHTVKRGDSLFDIAKKYGTTIDLIRKSNHLTGDLIKPGMKLKVSKAEFSIRVDKSENKLYLYADGELVKTYRVATGSGDRTPIGSFTIVSKLENPVWYKAGAVVPAGSPDNILGTRWMGFSAAGYGIHGTTIPESIGKSVTEGCVRMYNQEVEELYSIVPLKTKVSIVE